MRVLVTYGSSRGSTAGIAEQVAGVLHGRGFDVDVRPAASVDDVTPYDAVVVGGALYASHWHRDARRFVRRHHQALSERPVWLFSSGPLDDSAAEGTIPPVRQADRAAARIGARGHVTFGGALAADAKGFPASAMARTMAGDWRDPAQITGWAGEIATALQPSRHEPA